MIKPANRHPIIISLTDAGSTLAKQLMCLQPAVHQQQLGKFEHWHKPTPFGEKIQAAFKRGQPLIFITATGIAVRTLAPVLQSKLCDPPVIVLDELGQFVIPLLSGHQGGANELAAQLCDWLCASQFNSQHNSQHTDSQANSQLVITTANAYLNPSYHAGMGCERHCPESELRALLQQSCEAYGIAIEQIASINSIDIKADERGLIALAHSLKVPFQCYSASTLRRVETQLTMKSDYVFNTVGVYGVAESAALIAAQQLNAHCYELVYPKHKTAKATVALSRVYRQSPFKNAAKNTANDPE